MEKITEIEYESTDPSNIEEDNQLMDTAYRRILSSWKICGDSDSKISFKLPSPKHLTNWGKSIYLLNPNSLDIQNPNHKHQHNLNQDQQIKSEQSNDTMNFGNNGKEAKLNQDSDINLEDQYDFKVNPNFQNADNLQIARSKPLQDISEVIHEIGENISNNSVRRKFSKLDIHFDSQEFSSQTGFVPDRNNAIQGNNSNNEPCNESIVMYSKRQYSMHHSSNKQSGMLYSSKQQSSKNRSSKSSNFNKTISDKIPQSIYRDKTSNMPMVEYQQYNFLYNMNQVYRLVLPFVEVNRRSVQ